jgi:transposase InsO family protein
MSGSAAVVNYTPRSLHAARILVERNRAEMHALGFADGGVGGADRFQITAGTHYGSPAVMQALYESGVRIIRSGVPASVVGEHADDAFCADSRRVGVGV